MSRFQVVLLLATLTLASAAPVRAQQPDGTAVEEETMRHFQAILRLDTGNPPGNEKLVVDCLTGVYLPSPTAENPAPALRETRLFIVETLLTLAVAPRSACTWAAAHARERSRPIDSGGRWSWTTIGITHVRTRRSPLYSSGGFASCATATTIFQAPPSLRTTYVKPDRPISSLAAS